MPTLLNATSSISITAASSIATLPPIVVFFIIFSMVIVSAFMAIKYFRLFCYGLTVIISTFIIGWISKSITHQTVQGNYVPFFWICGILITILISVLIGVGIERTRIGKKWEKSFK